MNTANSKKALIVEDKKDSLHLVKVYPDKEAFRTQTTENGAEALRQARAEHPEYRNESKKGMMNLRKFCLLLTTVGMTASSFGLGGWAWAILALNFCGFCIWLRESES